MMVWDEPKRVSNLKDHGLDFSDADRRFEWDSALVAPTYPNRKTGRPRFLAIGFLDGDLVALVIEALGAEAISAVSLRYAARKERKLYAKC